MNILTVLDGLILRKVEPNDASTLFSILDENREHFMQWLPFVALLMDVSEMQDYVDSVASPTESADMIYVIIYKKELVGLVGLKDCDFFNNRAELGYWLSPLYEGLGIMKRSVDCLIDYAFNDLDMHRIELFCAEGNKKSERVAIRSGFLFEGIVHDGELMADGSYSNLKQYYLLNSKH